MSPQVNSFARFWSKEVSIFTQIATVLLLVHAVFSLIVSTYWNIQFGFLSFNVIGPILALIVLAAVVLNFVGKRNISFLVAIIATVAHFIASEITGSWNFFRIDWSFVFSGDLVLLGWLNIVSLVLLPLAAILLIIGRPEWAKLTK
jgi:hypothetical protein